MPPSKKDGDTLVYGPVPSRRLGHSLGVDLVPFKVCSFDCVYCQLGRTTVHTTERAQYATPEEIISEVDRGFYAVSFGGGQVEPATGDFVFGVSEGYLIEGGKVTRPCRGATLIGNCLQALARIDAVGSDFEMKTGFCGKAGQTAPVGTGQGHVRIRGMTVGGTAV